MSEFENKIKELGELITEKENQIIKLNAKCRNVENTNEELREEILDFENKIGDFNEDSKTQYAGLLFDLCIKMSNYSGNPYQLEKLLTENKII